MPQCYFLIDMYFMGFNTDEKEREKNSANLRLFEWNFFVHFCDENAVTMYCNFLTM